MNYGTLETQKEKERLGRGERLREARQLYEKAERRYGYWFAGLFLLIPITIWSLIHGYLTDFFAVDSESKAVSISVAAISLIIGSALASLVTTGERKRRDRARERIDRILEESED